MVLRSEALALVGDLDRSVLEAADATGVAVRSPLSKGKTCDSKYVWKTRPGNPKATNMEME
jgi:hypothetical protein